MNHYALSDVSIEMQRAGCGIVVKSTAYTATRKRSTKPAKNNLLATKAILHDVIRKVCRHHLVEFEDVMGTSRKYDIAAARHESIRAVANAVGWEPSCGNWAHRYWNTAAIGRLFGKHHTTVCYALGTISAKQSKRVMAYIPLRQPAVPVRQMKREAGADV